MDCGTLECNGSNRAVRAAINPSGQGDHRQRGTVSVAVVAAELVLAAIIFSAFMQNDGPTAEGMKFVEMREWIYPLNINYHLGVDGLSAPMVLLTAILGLCAVFASFNIQIRTREYFTWLLVLQGAVMGVFVSLDFVLFFIFWELELLPMYFLIAIWGTGRKEYSAMKFLIFTLLGSAFMLCQLKYFQSIGNLGNPRDNTLPLSAKVNFLSCFSISATH